MHSIGTKSTSPVPAQYALSTRTGWQRYKGGDHTILAARHALYLHARALKPARWSGGTRNWAPIGAVTLNPERDCVIKAHLEKVIQPMAA